MANRRLKKLLAVILVAALTASSVTVYAQEEQTYLETEIESLSEETEKAENEENPQASGSSENEESEEDAQTSETREVSESTVAETGTLETSAAEKGAEENASESTENIESSETGTSVSDDEEQSSLYETVAEMLEPGSDDEPKVVRLVDLGAGNDVTREQAVA